MGGSYTPIILCSCCRTPATFFPFLLGAEASRRSSASLQSERRCSHSRSVALALHVRRPVQRHQEPRRKLRESGAQCKFTFERRILASSSHEPCVLPTCSTAQTVPAIAFHLCYRWVLGFAFACQVTHTSSNLLYAHVAANRPSTLLGSRRLTRRAALARKAAPRRSSLPPRRLLRALPASCSCSDLTKCVGFFYGVFPIASHTGPAADT